MIASVLVAPDGAKLTAYVFSFARGRCSDGGSYASGLGGTIPGGSPLSAAGDVSYSRTYRSAYSFTRAHRRVSGTEVLSFALRFRSDDVSGVLRDRFRSASLHCHSGPVSFTAWRDGTARAPLYNDEIWSGRYIGTENRLNVWLPLGLITNMHFTWPVLC